MNGYDTDGDGENNFYTVNGRTFYYARYPIRVRRGELVRVYLANLTEFDLINSFHLHADFFRYQPTGTGEHWEYTDTVMQCQGQRGVLEIRFANAGRSCSTRISPSSPSSAGWATSRWRTDGDARRDRRRARVAALGARPGRRARRSPSALVVSLGDRVVDLVGGALRRPTSSTSARVELRPGEIRVLVRNPQRDDLTIASVTVDDAIVPFALDGPATLGRLRSSTIVVPYDWVPDEPLAVGVTSSTGIQTTHEIAAAVPTPQPARAACSATA